MKYALPAYFEGHAAALVGVAVLHAGIAAWAMQPEPPMVLPQQHILKVAMVTPAMPRAMTQPQPIQEVQAPRPVSIPPAKQGMVKAERKPVSAKPVSQPVQRKQPEPKPLELADARPTEPAHEFRQSRDTSNQAAAITKPVAAEYLNNPVPEYPRRARNRRQQGVVMLEVQVSREGQPRGVRVAQSSGYALLDGAAENAVRRWQFVPARRGSTYVDASVVVPIEFRIN